MKKYLILLCIIISAISCDEDFFETTIIVEPPNYESQLVINCFIEEGKDSIVVNISNSIGVFETDEHRKVDDATVEIFQNGNSFCSLTYDSSLNNTTLSESSCCFYSAKCSVDYSANDTYEIRVTAPNFEAIQVSQTIPSIVPELTATYKDDAGVDDYGEIVNGIEFEFQDIVGVENYYELEVHGTFVNVWEQDTSFYIITTWSANPQVEKSINGVVLKDTNQDGQRIKFTVLGYGLSDHTTPYVMKWRSISRDKYLYTKSLFTQSSTQGNPFAEPTTIYTNVENGLGIFSIERIKNIDVDF